MAMLASKSPYPTPSLSGTSAQVSAQYNASVSSYRTHASSTRSDHTMFASPTESEFSEVYDAPDAVRYVDTTIYCMRHLLMAHRHWDEDKVSDWLKRINCPQYVELFKRTFNASQPRSVSNRNRQSHQWREPHGDGPESSARHGHQESR